ncbi:iron ABC transporter permease [Pseudolabrys sp. FHR47]|uniref:FecCD family ABC transporter permease n=1 Tax=Pseudolabrys sp. FHR47 TaxID=2562284 RepID=UPI0010BEC911|nr:iron ABC transporter permease [Pseudolabrys sp. FHR47]
MSDAVVSGLIARPAGSRLRALLAGPLLFPILLSILLIVVVAATAIGGAGIPLERIPAALGFADPVAMTERDRLVLLSVRLPRIAIAIVIGAMLAASGAIMQGLFRNPLADPALVGVSSGGALAAATSIVIGDRMAQKSMPVSFAILPLAAFGGSLVTTAILQRLASRGRITSIAIFLLAGLAIAALANAGIGLLVFIADDRALRDITFWMLGSLGGATWEKVSLIAPFLLAMLAAVPFIGRGLDLLVLGESEAFHMGIAVERLKRVAIVLIAAMTGAAVAFAGVVGFVGIVVPHLLRLVIGPGHRRLLPASAILGAILLLAADTAARTIAAPAEVPIGVLTALVGAPFFLVLLLRQRGLAGL